MDLLEMRLQTQEYLGTVFVGAANFMFTNPGMTAIVAAVPAAIITAYVMVRLTPRRDVDEEMKRRIKLETHYADRIHDFMLDDLVNGVITRKEYKRDLKRMGIAYRLWDLLRPMKAKKGIAHRVKHNCAVNHSTLAHIRADKIPGPKLGEATPPSLPAKQRKVYLAVVGGKRERN